MTGWRHHYRRYHRSSGVVWLTLSNELSGARTISLPAGVEIYENNMLTTSSALKVGSMCASTCPPAERRSPCGWAAP